MTLPPEIVNNFFFICGKPTLRNSLNLLNVSRVNSHRYFILFVLPSISGRHTNCNSSVDTLLGLNLSWSFMKFWCTSQIWEDFQVSPYWWYLDTFTLPPQRTEWMHSVFCFVLFFNPDDLERQCCWAHCLSEVTSDWFQWK